MNKPNRKSVFGVFVATVGLTGAPGVMAQSSERIVLEEVIVTAQKRSENLQGCSSFHIRLKQ